MATTKKSSPAPAVPRIFTVRKQKVVLDAEVAALYGVTTKVLNQAIRRNADRFPEDFCFHLTMEEFAALRSQSVTSRNRGEYRNELFVGGYMGTREQGTVLTYPARGNRSSSQT